ncbi:MAG: GntR family transcriptional regulator, partial [Desulfobacterales bacterium]|nr:GntR family transcriptional regulator [Desulfobacterales bacterium]
SLRKPGKKQKSAPGMVVRLIKKDMESGKLNPGDKLPPQTKMAGDYGVGISSVREAVNTLEVMGLLEVIQGSGTYVKEIQPYSNALGDDLESGLANASPFELFELRELLECRAAGLAATLAVQSAGSVCAAEERTGAPGRGRRDKTESGMADCRVSFARQLTVIKAYESR